MSIRHSSNLFRAGLLNVDAPDLSELQTGHVKRSAWCTSTTCCGYKDAMGKTRRFAKIAKDTRDDMCPDCGFALLWAKS